MIFFLWGIIIIMKNELTGQLKFVYELLLRKNKPMTREEIYKEMKDSDDVKIEGQTPLQTITRLMNSNCIQSNGNVTTYKGNRFLFDRVSPQTWALLDEEITESLTRVIPLVEEQDQAQIVESVLRCRKTDSNKRQWIIDNFPNKCQRCGQETFYKKNDVMFFEVHHIKPLSEGGEDEITNLSKICPTCHRESHYGKEDKKIYNHLLNSTQFLLKK